VTQAHSYDTVERFSGFADVYDQYRPQPPIAIVDILTQLAGGARPTRVVDLGAGTGLSTRIWAGRADEVIAIEPNDDMRQQAEQTTAAFPGMEAVRYLKGRSDDSGLPDECADIVTASQALHWMEPEPTFAEVARILRPGGVFAAFDCDWPPTMGWEAEAAYSEFVHRHRELQVAGGIPHANTHWPKEGHLGRMKASGRFRYCREILVHSVEQGNAERLVGLAMSQGSVQTLLKSGVTEDELGLEGLRQVGASCLGDDMRPWYFSYRMRMGVK
jgi:ubiquinone/menaquinone biosynthesis C-methylase UbiE